jgi:hypothetical protein
MMFKCTVILLLKRCGEKCISKNIIAFVKRRLRRGQLIYQDYYWRQRYEI